MIDSHAHVHDKAFAEDRDAIVQRARDAGVETMITVGCDMADSQRALECARRYGIYASVGIHPHEAKDAPTDIAAAFAPFLEASEIVAIGETGLDYYYDHSPHDAQQRVLRDQLRVARERNVPVIFHQRDAFDDFVAILREEFTLGMRGVIHCFTGDRMQAETFVNEFGLKLGIGGVLTFKTAEPLREAVCTVGLEHLILETDCPYLAPVPHRGKRNEPAYVADTAAKLAEVLQMPLAEVVRATTDSSTELFGLRADREVPQR